MPRCRICNTPVTGDEPYCLHCGSPLQVPGALLEDAPRERGPAVPAAGPTPFPVLGVSLAMLIVAIAAVVLLVQSQVSGNWQDRQRHFNLWNGTPYLDGQPLAALDGVSPAQDPETAYASTVYALSQDGRTLLLYEMGSGVWTVYTADGDVMALPEAFYLPVLSPDGSAVSSVAEDGLHHYDLSTGTDTLVEPAYDLDAVKKGYTMIPCFSPDGSALAYAVEDDALFLWKDGASPQQVGTGTPLALSSGGELLYFRDGKGQFYVTDGGAPVLLAASLDGTYLFNADGTECLFCSDDKLFLTQNGGGAVLLPLEDPADEFQLIPPAGQEGDVNTISSAIDMAPFFYQTLRTFVEEPLYVTTRYNTMTLIRLDGLGEVTVLDERLSAVPARSADGSTLLWSTGDSLFFQRLAGISQPEEVPDGSSWTDSYFSLSPDGRACFLYSLRGGDWRLVEIASGREIASLKSGSHCLLSPDRSAFWSLGQSNDRITVEHLAWDGTRTPVLDVPSGASLTMIYFLDGVLVAVDDTGYYLSPDGGQSVEVPAAP